MRARDPKEMVLQISLPLLLNPQHLVSEHPYRASGGSPPLPLHPELQTKPETSEMPPRFYLAVVCTGKSLEPQKIGIAVQKDQSI